MSFVEPATPRYRIEKTFDGVEITIPVPRQWPMILFLGAWLVGWLIGELVVGATLISGLVWFVHNRAPLDGGLLIGVFLVAWFTGWTVAGGFVIRGWLWSLAGREVIALSRDELRIEKRAPLRRTVKRYRPDAVSSLRVLSQGGFPSWMKLYQLSWRGDAGQIAFDYGANTVRFGEGLNEPEARMLVQTLAAQHPELTEDKPDDPKRVCDF